MYDLVKWLTSQQASDLLEGTSQCLLHVILPHTLPPGLQRPDTAHPARLLPNTDINIEDFPATCKGIPESDECKWEAGTRKYADRPGRGRFRSLSKIQGDKTVPIYAPNANNHRDHTFDYNKPFEIDEVHSFRVPATDPMLITNAALFINLNI